MSLTVGPFFTRRLPLPITRRPRRSTLLHHRPPISADPDFQPGTSHLLSCPNPLLACINLLADRAVRSRLPTLRRSLAPRSAWTRARDCKPLPTEDIKAFVEEPHRKSGEMLEAYKIALDPSSWEAELAEAMRAHEEAMEGVDELEDDEDGEDEVGTASGAKKRKKTAAPAKDAKGKKAKVEKKAKVRHASDASFISPGRVCCLPQARKRQS